MENARILYKENKDNSNVSDGVLTGAPQFYVLKSEEKKAVEDLLEHNVEVVELFRSVFMPLQCIPNGKLYRKGDIAFVSLNDNEVVAKVEKLFLLDDGEHNWRSLALLNLYEPVLTNDGSALRHPISDTIIVQATNDKICFPVKYILRQVMLFPEGDNQFAVVDPARETIPLPQVMVPVYPEKGDFVSVQGDDGESWTANVIAVNYRRKTVDAYFFVKHNNFLANKLWIKEKPIKKQEIHWESILGILDGQWIGAHWKQTEQ